MRNTQEQPLEKALSDFPIPEGVIFAGREERRPVPDVFYDTHSSRFGFLDCTECDNKGFVYGTDADGYTVARECSCMTGRRNIQRMRKSGLAALLERCTFERYETPEPWQADVKRRTLAYLESEEGSWLYFAGQSGCGKTHLCTAVCRAFMERGEEVVYVLWRDLVHEIQGLTYRPEEYRRRMEELARAGILYIDDFLKTVDRSAAGRELAIAFEVINARYCTGKRTVISTELFNSELMEQDQALGSRITERAKGYTIQIRRSMERNYRMRM